VALELSKLELNAELVSDDTRVLRFERTLDTGLIFERGLEIGLIGLIGLTGLKGLAPVIILEPANATAIIQKKVFLFIIRACFHITL